MWARILKWFRRLSHRLLPSPCLLCGAVARDDVDAPQLCRGCVASFIKVGAHCRHCAEPVMGQANICSHCEQHTPSFERVVVPYRYHWPLSQLIAQFKFNRDYAVGVSLARLLAETLGEPDRQVDLIVPVPLHTRRFDERGFNQAEVLAVELAVRWNLAIDVELCSRVKDDVAQSGKNRRQRVASLSGAFKANRRMDGEHIAIVDDVLTTGVTADRLANVLLKAGAGSVEVWVLARTVNDVKGP